MDKKSGTNQFFGAQQQIKQRSVWRSKNYQKSNIMYKCSYLEIKKLLSSQKT